MNCFMEDFCVKSSLRSCCPDTVLSWTCVVFEGVLQEVFSGLSLCFADETEYEYSGSEEEEEEAPEQEGEPRYANTPHTGLSESQHLCKQRYVECFQTVTMAT